MQTEGWCYKHNCPLHIVPISGTWQYVCPECVKETQTYYATNVAITTRETPIRDMMVHGVPQEVSEDD